MTPDADSEVLCARIGRFELIGSYLADGGDVATKSDYLSEIQFSLPDLSRRPEAGATIGNTLRGQGCNGGN